MTAVAAVAAVMLTVVCIVAAIELLVPDHWLYTDGNDWEAYEDDNP